MQVGLNFCNNNMFNITTSRLFIDGVALLLLSSYSNLLAKSFGMQPSDSMTLGIVAS